MCLSCPFTGLRQHLFTQRISFLAALPSCHRMCDIKCLVYNPETYFALCQVDLLINASGRRGADGLVSSVVSCLSILQSRLRLAIFLLCEMSQPRDQACLLSDRVEKLASSEQPLRCVAVDTRPCFGAGLCGTGCNGHQQFSREAAPVRGSDETGNQQSIADNICAPDCTYCAQGNRRNEDACKPIQRSRCVHGI